MCEEEMPGPACRKVLGFRFLGIMILGFRVLSVFGGSGFRVSGFWGLGGGYLGLSATAVLPELLHRTPKSLPPP